jgi:hypothetical protein
MKYIKIRFKKPTCKASECHLSRLTSKELVCVDTVQRHMSNNRKVHQAADVTLIEK